MKHREEFYQVIFLIVMATAFTVLSGCGDLPGQRALSGGAIGAGAGTVGAVLLDANPVAGALIGAGAGAITGAVTSKKQIDLGDIR